MERLVINKAIRNVGIFVFVVISSGWLGVILDSFLTEQPEGDSLGMGVWLVLPLLTAFIIILFSKDSWKDLGLKPNYKGNIKWYLASVLIFPVVTAIVLIIGVVTNWIDLSAFNLQAVILGFGSALLVNFIIDIFEEGCLLWYLTSNSSFNLNDWKIIPIRGCLEH